MSVTSVKEIHNGRDGRHDAVGGAVEFTRTYRVWTDSSLTESEDVMNDPRLPSEGSSYPWNTSAWLQDKEAKNDDASKKLWTVTCFYSSRMQGAQGSGERQTNPLAEIAKVAFASEGYEYFQGVTRTGLRIVNSAGDPFEKPPEIEKYRRVWTVSRNISHPNYAGWAALGTLNSAAVTFEGGQGTIAAQAGLIRKISVSDWKERNRYIYYTATIEIVGPKTHNDGRTSHDLETLDQGMRRLSEPWPLPNGEMYVPGTEQCRDDRGEPVKSPALLDGQGHQLTQFHSYVVYLYWPVYPLSAWSGTVPGIL